MTITPSLQAVVEQRLNQKIGIEGKWLWRLIGGGSINETYCLSAVDQFFFCKINSATKFPHLFSKEAAGLWLLASQNKVRTPTVLDCFESNGHQCLLLEWIDEGSRTPVFWKTFGKQLAALHHVHGTHYGLEEDNYMGSVPQSNCCHQSWLSFFMAERLSPMIIRCREKGLWQQKQQLLFASIEKNSAGVFNEEPPSLLHGDLWSGNFLCSREQEPVLIDPAVYYGHRSMDLAMTTLFGRFDPLFYEAYHYHYPLPSNYREQWAFCNLYPLLVHLYLFGTGYLPQVEQTLQRFA